MAGLKWDGDDESDDDEESEDSDVQLEEVEGPVQEKNVEAEEMENPDECQHPWQDVTRETMKRSVNGSTIDTKEIYWCNSCKSILDVIE